MIYTKLASITSSNDMSCPMKCLPSFEYAMWSSRSILPRRSHISQHLFHMLLMAYNHERCHHFCKHCKTCQYAGWPQWCYYALLSMIYIARHWGIEYIGPINLPAHQTHTKYYCDHQLCHQMDWGKSYSIVAAILKRQCFKSKLIKKVWAKKVRY